MNFIRKKQGRASGRILAFVMIFAMLLPLPGALAERICANAAQEGEIEVQTPRITWIDASKQLPYNYQSIIGFRAEVRLLKDNTMTFTEEDTTYCGYGGNNEKATGENGVGRAGCYMLMFGTGKHDAAEYNQNAFALPNEGSMYENWADPELAKTEIVTFGVGSGFFVAQYLLGKGQSVAAGKDMQVGDTITLTYQGTSALFEDGNPYLTAYGYTSEFEVLDIEWITGVPVVTAEEDWDTVEKETFADIETVEDAGKQNGFNYVNIIRPKEGEGPFPVILWIHGGAWSTADRNSVILNTTMEYLLSKGYAFVSADYTLSTSDGELTKEEEEMLASMDEAAAANLKSTFMIRNASQGKQMLYDLKLAIRFLRANAEKYCLDTSFIAAMGESAGAHLSLLLATTNGSGEHEDKTMGWADYSSDVQAAVAYSLPSDLTADSAGFLQDYKDTYPLIASDFNEDAVKASNQMMAYYVLGYDYVTEHTVDGVEDDELYAAEEFMSPYQQVNSDTPPLYLIHGEADGGVPICHAYAMEMKAKTFMEEEDVKTAYYPDAGHVDKKYFDVYAQYTSTEEFLTSQLEKVRAAKKPGQDTGKEPDAGEGENTGKENAEEAGKNENSANDGKTSPAEMGGEKKEEEKGSRPLVVGIVVGVIVVFAVAAGIVAARRKKSD